MRYLRLGVFAVLVAGIAALSAAVALDQRHPCWRYSNAPWCGHFCDDDPCACPARGTVRDPYGAGPSCSP
jgi:hypothetical protein